VTGASGAVAASVAFAWLGMVLGISFLEAPLKFRAPGVTLVLGLGIGRIVFRALNRVEVGALAVLAVAVTLGPRTTSLVVPTVLLAVLLAVQMLGVRPRLNHRSDRVLAGEDVPRSREHLVYVACEVAKVVLLVATGTAALAG
jgi:hypothetical protein